jgi:hypothetical protein
VNTASRVKLAELFKAEAIKEVDARIAQLRTTKTFETSGALPEAHAEDIVVAGREVQLMIFRQSNVPFLAGQVLVTVQIARHGMGGVSLFQVEKGLVFSPSAPARDATTEELQRSGG